MSDIFAIAASLTIHGNALQFLEQFGSKLLGAHSGLKKLENQLENTHKLAIGLGMAFAGYEGLKGLLHLAEHGKELNHQQSMLLRNGIAYKDVIDETTKAYQRYTQAVPTASGPDFLRTANELVSVKGTLKGADEALVQSLKIEGLIGNATGKSAEGQGYDFWRTVEDKGVIQNKALTDQVLNAMAQGTIATGGKIGGADWYTYAKRAGTSWMGDSLDALPLQLMEMQTMTPTGAGTARKTFANMMEGSQKLSKRQRAAWDGVGLLGDDGLVKDHQLEQSRPDQFIQGIIDKLNSGGLDTFDKVKGWASKALNRKSADYFMTAYTGMTERDPETGKTRLEKERDYLGRAQGLDQAYGTMMKTDMGANIEALSKQWQSFMEAVGGPLSKAAIPILREVTDVINRMAGFADKHQALTEMAGDIAAVGSALLLLVGTIKAAKAALAISAALKGGGGALAEAEGVAAGVVSSGHGPGRSPSGPGGLSGTLIGKLGLISIAGSLGYEGYQYAKGSPEERAALDEAAGKRADANAASIAEFGRAARDALPWGKYLHFTDDPPALPPAAATADRLAQAKQSDIKVPAPAHSGPFATPALPDLGQSFDSMTKAIEGKIAMVPKQAEPAVNASMAAVGAEIGAGAAKLPSVTAGPIASAFATIAGQVAAAVHGLGRVGVNPTAPGQPDAMPSLGSPMSYRGSPPTSRLRTADARVVREQPIHVNIGGHEVKKVVLRQIVADNEVHRSVAGHDGHGSYLPLGSDMADAV